MGTGTREGTKKSVGADRATSVAGVRLLQIGHDDLVHLEHGTHHALEFSGSGSPINSPNCFGMICQDKQTACRPAKHRATQHNPSPRIPYRAHLVIGNSQYPCTKIRRNPFDSAQHSCRETAGQPFVKQRPDKSESA